LLHTYQTAPNNGWNADGWESLGGGYQIAQVAVGYNYDGRLEVFGVDGHGTLLHTYQTTPNNGWNADGWEGLGGGYQIAQVAVGYNYDGRIEVFGVDGHGTLLHLSQTTPSINDWSGWDFLGSGHKIAQVAATQDQDGRLEVLVLDNGGLLMHTYQTAPSNGWTADGWEILDGTGGTGPMDVTVARNQDGRLEVFWTLQPVDAWGDGGPQSAFACYQTAPNNGWSSSVSFGLLVST
jgi:hypothetical protein